MRKGKPYQSVYTHACTPSSSGWVIVEIWSWSWSVGSRGLRPNSPSSSPFSLFCDGCCDDGFFSLQYSLPNLRGGLETLTHTSTSDRQGILVRDRPVTTEVPTPITIEDVQDFPDGQQQMILQPDDRTTDERRSHNEDDRGEMVPITISMTRTQVEADARAPYKAQKPVPVPDGVATRRRLPVRYSSKMGCAFEAGRSIKLS